MDTNTQTTLATIGNDAESDRNLRLWRQVRDVPAECKRGFSRPGGFSGTAITAMWFFAEATRVFGPVGQGWGWEIQDEKYVEGAPIVLNGAVACREVVHVVRVAVWYMLDGQRCVTGPYFGHTPFIAKRKDGVWTNDEAPKMSVTDAVKKCLSTLGFGAGVWLNDYSDDKWVRSIESEPSSPAIPARPAAPALPAPGPAPMPTTMASATVPLAADWSDPTQRNFFVARLRQKIADLGPAATPMQWQELYEANQIGIGLLARQDAITSGTIMDYFAKKGVRV